MNEYFIKTLYSLLFFIVGISIGILLVFLIILIIKLIKRKLKKITINKEYLNPIEIIDKAKDEYNSQYKDKLISTRIKGAINISKSMVPKIASCYDKTGAIDNVSIKAILNATLDINKFVYDLLNEIINSNRFKIIFKTYASVTNLTRGFKNIFIKSKEKQDYLSLDFHKITINEILDILDHIQRFTKEGKDTSHIPLFDNMINEKINKFIDNVGIELMALYSNKILLNLSR